MFKIIILYFIASVYCNHMTSNLIVGNDKCINSSECKSGYYCKHPKPYNCGGENICYPITYPCYKKVNETHFVRCGYCTGIGL